MGQRKGQQEGGGRWRERKADKAVTRGWRRRRKRARISGAGGRRVRR